MELRISSPSVCLCLTKCTEHSDPQKSRTVDEWIQVLKRHVSVDNGALDDNKLPHTKAVAERETKRNDEWSRIIIIRPNWISFHYEPLFSQTVRWVLQKASSSGWKSLTTSELVSWMCSAINFVIKHKQALIVHRCKHSPREIKESRKSKLRQTRRSESMKNKLIYNWSNHSSASMTTATKEESQKAN